jgi:hypothetical protein
VIEAAAEATQISIHWCALDVARVQRVAEPVVVAPGQVLGFDWAS